MSEKTYQVQLGEAPAEILSQKELDALTARYGAERMSRYDVRETKPAPPKPSPEPETAGAKPKAKTE